MNIATHDPSSFAMRPLRPFAIAALLLAAPALASAAGPTATAHLKQSNEKLDKLLKRKEKGEDGPARQEMKQVVNGLLDYDELSKRSLSAHWDTLNEKQRSEFVTTLRELIEKNYLKQLRTNLEYEVQYKGEQGTADDATVSTVVKIRTKGKSTDTPIEYKMKRTGERWMVYDIITDDVSMVKNYRQQFNKIIANEGFEALIRKMRNKIAEVEEGKGKSEGAAAPAGQVAAAKPAPAAPAAKPGAAKPKKK